jgi:tetratricopeptide (TPR) repeat protein
VRRDNVAFLLGGLFYGALLGFGAFYVVEHRPGSSSSRAAESAAAPAGPMAPTQVGAASGAPMMEEVARLQRRLKEAPGDLDAAVQLAHLYHDAGMWQQAVDLYQRALEGRPGDPNLLTDMGVCFQGLEQYQKALDLFARAQEADPGHWQSLYNTVIVAGFNLGQFDVAAEALTKLERIDPPPPGIEQLRQTLEHVRTVKAPAAAS